MLRSDEFLAVCWRATKGGDFDMNLLCPGIGSQSGNFETGTRLDRYLLFKNRSDFDLKVKGTRRPDSGSISTLENPDQFGTRYQSDSESTGAHPWTRGCFNVYFYFSK